MSYKAKSISLFTLVQPFIYFGAPTIRGHRRHEASVHLHNGVKCMMSSSRGQHNVLFSYSCSVFTEQFIATYVLYHFC